MAFVCNYLPSVIIFNIFRYLSPSDRLRASATCKTWRECLFNCSQWPQKSLTIDLLRRTTSSQTLRRNKHNKQLKPTIDSSIALKSFLHKCSRFLNQLNITFDPNSSQSLNQLIQILDILLSTEEYNYNDNNNNLNENNTTTNDNHCVHNSRCLRRLTLNPINVTKNIANNNNENNSKVCQLLQLLVQRLEQLIQRCDSLEHISMGCLQPVLNHSNRLLQLLAKCHSHSLKCLHLASVKSDPDFYPVVDLSVQLLEPFASLRQLSIDFDSVNDQMLRLLAQKATLDQLAINVHGIDDEHEGLSKSSWSLLTQNNPNLKVTVNLIHTDDSYEILRDSLFDTDMPLAHFRAYFIGSMGDRDETICYLINLVTDRHSRTLKSVTLVNALKPFSLEPNPVFAEMQENPLVMLAWRSRLLQSLTIIGYEVCDTDLIAITRLRGSSLKHFEVPMCCISLKDSPIVEDEGYYDIYDRQLMSFLDGAPPYLQSKVISEIAGPLDRYWYPMQFEELPKAVINRFDEMQTTYLSTILKEQTICGESYKTCANSNDSN